MLLSVVLSVYEIVEKKKLFSKYWIVVCSSFIVTHLTSHYCRSCALSSFFLSFFVKLNHVSLSSSITRTSSTTESSRLFSLTSHLTRGDAKVVDAWPEGNMATTKISRNVPYEISCDAEDRIIIVASRKNLSKLNTDTHLISGGRDTTTRGPDLARQVKSIRPPAIQKCCIHPTTQVLKWIMSKT